MNEIRLVMLISAAAALAACDDEAYRTPAEPAPPPAETQPLEPPAAETPPPDAVPAPSVDPSRLPPPPETSEETVQPESETLFY